jgi:hypothetical protein
MPKEPDGPPPPLKIDTVIRDLIIRVDLLDRELLC